MATTKYTNREALHMMVSFLNEHNCDDAEFIAKVEAMATAADKRAENAKKAPRAKSKETVENENRAKNAVELMKHYEEPEVVSFINGILGTFVRTELPDSQDRPAPAADEALFEEETAPADKPDARKMLKYLSGKKHTVITGVCILSPEKPAFSLQRFPHQRSRKNRVRKHQSTTIAIHTPTAPIPHMLPKT